MYTYTQDAKASRRSRPARRALFGDSERREENLKKRARSDAVCLDYRQTASSLATRKPLQRGSPFALHGTIAPRGLAIAAKHRFPCRAMPQKTPQNQQSHEKRSRVVHCTARKHLVFSGFSGLRAARSLLFQLRVTGVMSSVPCTTAFQGHRNVRPAPNVHRSTAAYSRSASHCPPR